MIRLERRDAARNMARFYLVDVQPALFGWSVVKEWGRIGWGGQVRVDFYGTPEAAEAACAILVEKKRGRGYQQKDHAAVCK